VTRAAPTGRPDGPPGTDRTLRDWQARAVAAYHAASSPDFLVTATPGSGKTTLALTIAIQLRQARAVDRVIVVVPTDHLRTQWADAAAAAGLTLDPTVSNDVGPLPAHAHGYVTTYAQVASRPLLHQARTRARRSLVVLDEIHHAGDSLSWGEAVAEAFGPARRRLALTGTPFRTRPTERIPFVRYDEVAPGELVCVPDYSYGYRQALADGVVRPVVFAAYTGTSRWLTSAGEVVSASLSEPATRAQEQAAWRTALDPRGAWVPHVAAAADSRLADLRAAGIADAAGLMLAGDQATARAYARVLAQVTGQAPVVAVSDDPGSSRAIASFAAGGPQDPRWLVAVRQVSEGVDIPRLAVCVWTTSYRTELFFQQAVGRVIRARHRRESATVFLPAVRPLLALAAAMEAERDHVVRRVDGPDEAFPPAGPDDLWQVRPSGSDPGAAATTPLDAEAEFAHLLHAGQAILPVAPEPDGPTLPAGPDPVEPPLPGLLSPQQTAALLAARDAQLRDAHLRDVQRRDAHLRDAGTHRPGGVAPSARPTDAGWRSVQQLRRQVNRLVGALAARSGRPHAQIHVQLRRAVPGPPSAQAPAEVLARRCDYLRRELEGPA
jgi:superfamily II DNA or RNA helicase